MEVTKEMIFEWLTPSYWCECIAQLDNGNREVTSRRGEFKVASKATLQPPYHYL